jgi:hypothetical protein
MRERNRENHAEEIESRKRRIAMEEAASGLHSAKGSRI